jgi:HNH endonuclease
MGTRYTDLCAYTIRHSLALEDFSRSAGPRTVSTKQKAWTTIAQLVAEGRDEAKVVPVLFSTAEGTLNVVACADLLSVERGRHNAFKFTNFKFLDPPLLKTQLRLRDGRGLSPEYIRDYAICRTPADLSERLKADGRWHDNDEAADIDAILKDPKIKDETTRKVLVEARLGQGRFRSDLIERWSGACAVTRCAVLDILRASHIKPWKISNNEERLDPANGILLSANLDALFDAGLVTFEDSGRMLISKLISTTERKRLGLPRDLVRVPDRNEKGYLAEHRRSKFQP